PSLLLKHRDFSSGDREACPAIFDSNTPDSYHRCERPVFAAFIDSGHFLPARLRELGAPAGHLYVVESGTECVACGGWYLDGVVANLSFGTGHRSRHREGLGRCPTA